MSARQPKGNDKKLVHISMPKKWLRLVEQAAKLKNMSRSNFIATVAHTAAERDIAKAAANG